MHFFICSRAAAHVAEREDDPALDEAHWAYMDRFADGMVARGPMLGADRTSWLGSIHIVDLPSASAAHEFVEHEPYHRAGAYAEHLIRRFHDRLERTMWEFPGASEDPRFVVLAHGPAVGRPELPRERLIVDGDLSMPDGSGPAGAVWALHAPTRDAVAALFDDEVEIIDWEFGGRR